MFKKIAFFALFLAVTGLFAATSVNAQRLVKGGLVMSVEPTVDTLIQPEANPAVNLDQCQNGANTEPPTLVNCGPGWANGNANGNNSHYDEGTNIHYRAIFTNLVPGTLYTVTFAFDKTHSAGGGDYTKNAIDYINNYDATAVGYTVDPCYNGAQTALCTGGPVLIPIPDDPGILFDPAGRFLAGWGIAPVCVAVNTPVGCEPLTAVAPVGGWVSPTSNTTHEQQFSVTFRAIDTTAVLAWSGHIATASDWNTLQETSASSIQGSPYHMRVSGNTGWGGQQDRSLSTTAVVGTSAAGV
ncbi:MAG: hypothetical protein PSX80_13695, partial [bacterium]|nr:hypothetical protein [bacterium]